MASEKATKRNPWAWVPSLYFAEGIPYIVVMTLSVIMYKRLGVSNTEIALYTSWLYLPWVIKPLWSPLVDLTRTKRFWTVIMQLFIGAGLAGIALTIPADDYIRYTMAFFWLLAFSSATHDIAADGFYMIALPEHEQALYVGIRSTFYRVASITGQGLLVILAGTLESSTGLPPAEFSFRAVKGDQANVRFLDDSVQFRSVAAGDLQILVSDAKTSISLVQTPKETTDSLIGAVKEYNLSNGFYGTQAVPAPAAAAEEEEGWYQTYISKPYSEYIVTPLEDFLRTNFGDEAKQTARVLKAGNVGIVYIRLSEAPGRETVVNISKSGGDNNFTMLEGARIVFTDSNWNIPAAVAVQTDPKLNFESAATFQAVSGNIPLAWSITFYIIAGLFLLFFIWHKFILPYPVTDKAAVSGGNIFKEFFRTFALFFKKEKIGLILGFLLLFRFAEAQLVKLASPFLLDTKEVGGLGLTTAEVGFVYGTVGILFLTLGGILGGIAASKKGLKYWLMIMVVSINVPDLLYVYMAYAQPENFLIINICVAIEQFGYGFGFTAYMLFLIYVSEGEHKTAHYAIGTGFMALGMMIPGMFSGWLQELIGYQNFFVWVMIATIPGFIIAKYLPVSPTFGMKKE
ncbi:MAG: MFS transporter [Ignavibacteriales bacterium]|nr:MAG: MFS transporter [Ignavibacteriales bacterium]